MLKIFYRKTVRIPTVILMLFLLTAVSLFQYKFMITANAATDFETILRQFPESYRTQLSKLHAAHPNWRFEPFYVKENWNDTILANQLVLKRNLVPTGDAKMSLSGVDHSWYPTPTSWKSTQIAGAYDWSNNQWVAFDSGVWAQASEEAICYIMDPRNWLTEENVFMFEKLSYDKAVQTYDVVKIMLDDTFMDCDYAQITGDDGQSYTYGEVLIKAADAYGVSPIHLCARIVQEQGTGTYHPESDTYTVSGILASGLATDDGGKTFRPAVSTDTVVYYNYFNINAGGTGQEILNNGGKEAMNAGWTSPYLAVTGGAKKLTNNYIQVGQDTLYFQKFNVVYHNSSGDLVAWKQYMQNLLAPVNEGSKARSGYEKANLLDSAFTFRIPVYQSGFPNEPFPRPTPLTSTANPNYKLKNISVGAIAMSGDRTELALTPTFHMDTDSYNIIVPYVISGIDISAEPIAATSTVEGSGQHSLQVGSNVFHIVCQSEYKTTKTYRLTVTRQSGSTLLKSVTPSAGNFTEAFADNRFEYMMYADNATENLELHYETDSEIAVLQMRYQDTVTDCADGSTGPIALNEGENIVYLDVYPSGEDRSFVSTYTVKILRYSKTVLDTKDLQTKDSYINGFAIGDTVKNALARLSVSSGSAVITDSDNTKKADSDLIGTGDYLTVYDANGYLFCRYQILLYGDVNGDGKVNLFDYAYLKKHHWVAPFLTGIRYEAANVSTRSSAVDLFDMAVMKNYIWNNGKISQTR